MRLRVFLATRPEETIGFVRPEGMILRATAQPALTPIPFFEISRETFLAVTRSFRLHALGITTE